MGGILDFLTLFRNLHVSRPNLQTRMATFGDNYCNFEGIKSPRSQRPDLHAFLLLDELVPGKPGNDLISASEHDEFYLDIDMEQLNAVISDAQIEELVRCGVRYESVYGCLAMFA